MALSDSVTHIEGSVILFIQYKIYTVVFIQSFLYGHFLYVQFLYSSIFIQFKIYTVTFYTVQNLYSSKFIRVYKGRPG
jgi:hypothetical protein